MDNKFNSNFEGEVLKKIDAATASIKKELTPLLDEKVRSESAIDHTMSLLDTDVINQQMIQDSLNNGYDQGQGQSEGQTNTKEKVRVRTIGGLSPYSAASSSASNEPVNSNYLNMNGGYSNEDPNVWRTGGYTETMILIGTGVLVLLVFMVSYLILNYFG